MKNFNEIGISNGKRRDIGEWMTVLGVLATCVGYVVTWSNQRWAPIEKVHKELMKESNQK